MTSAASSEPDEPAPEAPRFELHLDLVERVAAVPMAEGTECSVPRLPASGPAGDRCIVAGRASRPEEAGGADVLHVPRGAFLTGRFQSAGLHLAGRLAGRVECAALPVVIGPGALLEGLLVSRADVHVAGKVVSVRGEAIVTGGWLTLSPGAHVKGDVRCQGLTLCRGAVLEGVARGG